MDKAILVTVLTQLNTLNPSVVAAFDDSLVKDVIRSSLKEDSSQRWVSIHKILPCLLKEVYIDRGIGGCTLHFHKVFDFVILLVTCMSHEHASLDWGARIYILDLG
ncbi:hypothetical protein HG530_010882 [Fusarium avenaceum]|nr:hypothetical protein HG530_010882 [Fusarium avenaceum]